MQCILRSVDRVEPAVGLHHHVVLRRGSAAQVPLLDQRAPRCGGGGRDGAAAVAAGEQLWQRVLGCVGGHEGVGQFRAQALGDHRAASPHQQDELLPLLARALPARRPIALLVTVGALLLQLGSLGRLLDLL